MTNPYLEKTDISLSPHSFLFSLSAYMQLLLPSTDGERDSSEKKSQREEDRGQEKGKG